MFILLLKVFLAALYFDMWRELIYSWTRNALYLLLGHLDVWFLNLGQNKGAGKSVLFWVYNLPQWPPGLVSLLMVCNCPKQFEKASWVLERAPESFFQGALPKPKFFALILEIEARDRHKPTGAESENVSETALVRLHPLSLTAPHPLFMCVHWLEILISVSHVQNVDFRIPSSCWSRI